MRAERQGRRSLANPQLDDAIQALEHAIAALVAARQAMRRRGASTAALEANRLELGRRQRQLACAHIGRHVPSSASCEEELLAA
jgi:hypothetical protein